MTRPIEDSVVVITGASSGIGRAIALEFAGRGSSLAIASRAEDSLRQVAEECGRLGADVLVVPTDTTDEMAVQSLAHQTVERFGRIDVWVNDAAVSLFARFEESPPDDYRQVIETNLFGYIYGARAALPYMRRQCSGTLINIASMVSAIPQPYTSAYVISKAGVRALGACLRQELALDGTQDIHVCTVMPAAIDTPFFQHAANYTGRPVKAIRPVYEPELVAQAVARLVEAPRREVFVGNAARVLSAQMTMMPAATERIVATMVDKDHLRSDAQSPPTKGNLYQPMPEME